MTDNTFQPDKIQQVKKILNDADRIAVIVHERPDGDAIGSALALKLALEQNGKKAVVISPDRVPDFLRWLPGADQIIEAHRQLPQAKEAIQSADVVFITDFNALYRAGEDLEKILSEKLREAPFVMIDHHLQPDAAVPYIFSDPDKASTAELIYTFIRKSGLADKITPDIATALYTGILTDTGSFRFNKTTGETHRVVSDLIDAGADNSRIYSRVFDTYSYDKLQLLGEAIRRMKIIPECAASYIILDEDTLKKYNYRPGDTEGIVNYGLMLDGTRFTTLVSQKPGEKVIRLSFRSKGDFDVNTFARRYFNGGGHKNAAGGKFEGSIQELEERLNELIRQHCDEIRNA